MRNVHRGFRCILLAAASLLCRPLLAVDLPSIRIDTVLPDGGRAGSEVDVAITGGDIEEANAMQFSHPGITAKLKPDKHFAVSIAADVPPGIYDARVCGLHGISNPRAFVVGDLPETVRTKANNKPADAVEIPVDSVFSGVTTAGSYDFFKFTAKKGQRLIIECAAHELDSRMEPVLAVLDSQEQEVEDSRRGGLLDFTAPTDGTYLLRVNDLTFGGSPEHFYRLSIRTGAYLDYVFPPAGQAGEKGKFTLYGRNLPGGVDANIRSMDGKPLEKLDVEIGLPAISGERADGLAMPASAGVDGFSYRLKTPGAVSNPVFISFADAPVVLEQEPNNDPAKAQKVTPPCEIAGQFYPAADVDCYTFDAKKGEVWSIEVISNRLGLPTNPFALVQRDTADVREAYGADAVAAEKRFPSTSNDPAFRLEVKEDGAYRVKVRDLFGETRRDPRSVYLLSIRKEFPDFRLAAVVEPSPEKKDDRAATPAAAFLRGGGTIGVKVHAFRRDDFAGDIELSAEGLPPGVTCVPTTILAGKNDGWVLLTACEKPERFSGSIHIIGKAKVGDTELVHEARGGTVVWPLVDFGNGVVETRLARDFALAVSATEPAPVSVEPAENKVWDVATGGKLEIPLKVAWRGDLKGPLKLKGFGAPGIETFKELDVNAGAATVTAALDLAAVKIPAGAHTIYFQAEMKGKYHGKDVSTEIYSAPIRIAVKTPEPKESK